MNRPTTTIWTARILPRVQTTEIRHLDFNRDISLDGRWIATSGTDHQQLRLALSANAGPTPYTIK